MEPQEHAVIKPSDQDQRKINAITRDIAELRLRAKAAADEYAMLTSKIEAKYQELENAVKK